jgi:putative ABC transport system permease protein
VANVVSAAVIAGYRRIGVLKSIGFTPAQVAASYLAQLGIPALAGAAAGTVLGDWLVVPVIGLFPVQGERVFVPVWVDITVPLGMLALTGLAAAIPALRAGRKPAVETISAAQSPGPGAASSRTGWPGGLRYPAP